MRIAVFWSIVTLICLCSGEFHSSTEELVELLKNEEKIMESVKDLMDDLKDLNDKIAVKFKIFEEEHNKMKKAPHAYVENPLNSFLLIKRLSHDIESITNMLEKKTAKFNNKIKKFKLSSDDLNGAVEGIYRLQEFYDLKSEHLAKGFVYNRKYRKDLLIDDLMVLGKLMTPLKIEFAAEYFNLAKTKNLITKELKNLEILEQIFKIYHSNNMLKKSVEVLNEILEIDPSLQKYEDLRLTLELQLLGVDEKHKKVSEKEQLQGSHYTAPKELLILKKACKGQILKSPEESSYLHCRYYSPTVFTKIAPFKIVEANLKPFVVIFLDVVSDDEIEVMKSMTRSKFSRAQILTNTTLKASSTRVAKLHWQDDFEHKVFETLTRRVGDMSGLNMETAEMWQIQNYGIGGHYNAHYDFSSQGITFSGNTGNRIATALFYLNDVELGGATVFPFLGIFVPPRKGNAVFWYNLSSSGHLEYATRHASCPVLKGSKWVANKWLHEYGQERARPCGLKPALTNENYHRSYYDLSFYGIYV